MTEVQRTATERGFGERLLQAAQSRGRLCVGIDPHPELLEAWGLPQTVAGLAEFSRICVEAFADTAALVKPQVALYEAYGSRGFAVLEETVAALRATGCLVLADAKRGDIGSTMAAYARAWLADGSPLAVDAVTVSPYLGVGALDPALDLAEETGRGVFVLAATSNPEGASVQHCTDAAGRTVAQQVVDTLAARNRSHGEAPGNLGVVVGATCIEPPALGKLGGPVLLPGVGAQGAGPEDVDRITEGVSHLAFPNVSRGILKAGPDGLRDAVRRTAAQFPGRG